VSTPGDRDVTRRTLLAAERTWLAWWRSGIAAATAAVGVGGAVPQLVGRWRTPYIVLGAGYAALAVCIFTGGAARRRQVEQALERGEWVRVSGTGLLVLTVAAVALALGTLVVIAVQG
jgi:putative membrane protein